MLRTSAASADSVEGKFRNKLFTTTLYFASVVFSFHYKGLYEKISCREKRAGVPCVRHQGRTSEGKCCSSVDNLLERPEKCAGKERWLTAVFNAGNVLRFKTTPPPISASKSREIYFSILYLEFKYCSVFI
jgi:hypothetical protein